MEGLSGDWKGELIVVNSFEACKLFGGGHLYTLVRVPREQLFDVAELNIKVSPYI